MMTQQKPWPWEQALAGYYSCEGGPREAEKLFLGVALEEWERLTGVSPVYVLWLSCHHYGRPKWWRPDHVFVSQLRETKTSCLGCHPDNDGYTLLVAFPEWEGQMQRLGKIARLLTRKYWDEDVYNSFPEDPERVREARQNRRRIRRIARKVVRAMLRD